MYPLDIPNTPASSTT